MDKLDIREASTTHNAAFVSSIRTYGNLGPFRPENRAEFKGIRLFDLLLRPNQVVCGSTVQRGDPDGALYGNWGIILGSGDIQQAFPYDAASYVIGHTAVSPYGWRNDHVAIRTQVANAINYRAGHNEVDIALNEQSVVGVFFGNKMEGVDGVDLPSEAVLEMIEPTGLPFYQLQNGEFYRKDIQGNIEAAATPLEELLEYRFHMPTEISTYMRQELCSRLLLPPRNAISAGWIQGTIQSQHPSETFGQTMDEYLTSADVSRRHFGSMAVFAAQFEPLFDKTAFTHRTYQSFVGRLTTGNMLRASDQDIDYYLQTGATPDYLGKI